MGQIFTWDEVRENRIPRLADFPRVIETLRTTVALEGSILGALVCGSVIRGDHTVRSDVDCFVLYDHARQSEAFAWMKKATTEAKSRRVPLSCLPCDILLAGTRMHHVGRSFFRHLEKSAEAGGLLKGDPLGRIVHSLSEVEELESYLRVKMYNLQEAYALSPTFSNERMASYLKKLLEAPMHVARKTIALQALLDHDSKEYILSRYRTTMPQRMWEQFEPLIALDAEYTKQLFEQRRVPRKAAYDRLLASVANRSEDVLTFIRSNLAFIAERAR